MSRVETVEVQCDHCGFEAKMTAGDGAEGWHNGDDVYRGDLLRGADLCPNCVSELKEWLVAGPQHAEMRERIKREVAVRSGRYAERLALSRHPASNSKLGFRSLIDEDIEAGAAIPPRLG